MNLRPLPPEGKGFKPQGIDTAIFRDLLRRFCPPVAQIFERCSNVVEHDRGVPLNARQVLPPADLLQLQQIPTETAFLDRS